MTEVASGQLVEDSHRQFKAFFDATEPRLRAALVASFGGEAGRDATAEAFRYGWEHRTKVLALDNPAGYLFQVGRRWGRRQRGRSRRQVGFDVAAPSSPNFEPGLAVALESLSVRQRQAVVLVHGYGLTHQEAAELLGVGRTSIQNHVERGLAKMRERMGQVQ
ncbi:MAG TPA: RNA polymerase sigma factor [Ilumatobacteraceae bacterium]|nr:RNA polymerase sigma factor [Ilumatobacteraceae bacterium]